MAGHCTVRRLYALCVRLVLGCEIVLCSNLKENNTCTVRSPIAKNTHTPTAATAARFIWLS